MKKTVLSLIALFLAIPFVWAVPADPTPFPYTQPDGSVITLRMHGDEYLSWTTNVATGEVVEKGADGFYRPVPDFNLTALAADARQQREIYYAQWGHYEEHRATNFGDNRILCILIEFSDEDSEFSVENPHDHFYNMLNQEGYSENGAIGSVRDYYIDNSLGQFRPTFDVFGPVKVSLDKATCSDAANKRKSPKVYQAIIEAYNTLVANGSDINTDNYDNDGDGAIDMILCYYPGHNPAEGGDAQNVWPHQTTYDFGNLGGKKFERYFCSSELRGSSGTDPAAIGTTCHEFAHSLGLPDFYDTDYEENGGNNFADGNYSVCFDLMAGGNYNDSGRRPPMLSVMERNMLGWMDYPAAISAAGQYTLEPIQNNKGYKLETAVSREYYYLEYRNSQKWDSVLPEGLLFYHVDQSDRVVPLTYECYGQEASAYVLWEHTNKINAFYGHPCYYLVQTDKSSLNYNAFVFPGSANVNSFIPMDWDGNQTGAVITDISPNGASASFTVSLATKRMVLGYVRDTDGNPIEGAEVCLTPSQQPFAAAPAQLSTSLITVTDSNGYYSLELEDESYPYQILCARKQGYVAHHTNLSISGLYTSQSFTLMRTGEGQQADLYKYDPALKLYDMSIGKADNTALAMCYSAEELESMDAVGALLKSVSFKVGNGAPDHIEKTYVIVAFDTEIVLCEEVSSSYAGGSLVTQDISGHNLTIPAGKDVFIGYGFSGIQSGYYPFCGYLYTTATDAAYAIYNFLNPESNWVIVNFKNPDTESTATHPAFQISARIMRTKDVEFSDLGVSYIKLEGDVPTVAAASGKSVKSTTWFLDGVSEGTTPTALANLPDGAHTYMARILYYDGSVERIYYDVEK